MQLGTNPCYCINNILMMISLLPALPASQAKSFVPVFSQPAAAAAVWSSPIINHQPVWHGPFYCARLFFRVAPELMASRTEPGASSTQHKHSLFIKRPSTTTPTNYARLGSLTVRWCTRFDHKSSACNPRSRFWSSARKTVAVRLGGSGRLQFKLR